MSAPAGTSSEYARPDWFAGERAILFQRCASCGRAWYLPRKLCSRCGSVDLRTKTASGDGVVHACTLVSRAPREEFRDLAPYLLVFVDAQEGFRMMAHGEPGLAIGDAVQATFREHAGGLLPFFVRSP